MTDSEIVKRRLAILLVAVVASVGAAGANAAPPTARATAVASTSRAVNSPAGHITRLSFRPGRLGIDPTFFVSFSFNGCPRVCLIAGSPVFSLHRGLSAKGPRVTLGTYLYRYDFDDARAAGSTRLKPNLRSLGCRTKTPTYRTYTVTMTATASQSSGEYPVSASRSIRVLCRAH